jgi:immune inhibitor A
MKTTAVIGVLLALLLLACACCTWLTTIDWKGLLEPLLSAVEPTAEPPVTPQLTRGPLPPETAETERLLEETLIPVRDLHELAIRLRGVPPDTPRTVNPEGPPDYPVGTCRTFHASNVDTNEHFDLTACLRYKNDVVYMWVEEGVKVDEADLKAAADLFATKTYPNNRNFFGSEWSPGVDNDPRLHILHARNLGDTVAGYYSSADEFVPAVREDSNAMEMFYIQIENVTVNDEFYNGVLAHEFQHMIHWYNDRNEDTWLNEGSSELASYLNGYDTGGSDYLFSRKPDTQLNSWPEGPGTAGANYGASYLFMSYFLDRFGAEATRALIAHDENGFASVDAVLADLGTGMTHVDLFADWVVANLLDDPNLADGRYGYREIDPPPFKIETRLSNYPTTRQATVHQYAADYIELTGDRPLRFSFTGSTQVGLMDTQAHSGKYLWWSNRGDDSDMTLTREFDLTGAQKATLEYWCWYDIEEDWDYAYVEVSTDGGKTWEILTTPSGTPENPNGNSFGWGYTGRSGGGSKAEWIQETVDLTPYAGKRVLVRFEYITDDAVNRPGFALDDVSVPEIGYFSDFEADGGGWEAAGFARHANVLPQRWLVQLVLFGPQTTVQRLELNPDQTGEWEIPLGGGVDRAVVVISAYAPVTTEVASYQYSVR